MKKYIFTDGANLVTGAGAEKDVPAGAIEVAENTDLSFATWCYWNPTEQILVHINTGCDVLELPGGFQIGPMISNIIAVELFDMTDMSIALQKYDTFQVGDFVDVLPGSPGSYWADVIFVSGHVMTVEFEIL